MQTMPRSAPSWRQDLLTTTASGPGRRDAALVVPFAILALLEAALRDGLTMPITTTAVTIAMLAALPWRRRHPLPVAVWVAVLGVGAGTGLQALGHEATPPVAMVALLTVPYALFRHGTTPMRNIGGIVLGLGVGFTLGRDIGPVDVIEGGLVVLSAMLLGAFVRQRAEARTREIEMARSTEREALARDLHDTVAHHVTTIAIRAQVGSALPDDREQVARSFAIIEREADTVLTEMRALVRTLRDPGDCAHAPAGGLARLASLAHPGPPQVIVHTPHSSADDVTEIVQTSVFRIAQEAVTNARRHAHGAETIEVTVTTTEDRVLLEVRDDAPAHAASTRTRIASTRAGAVSAPAPAGTRASGAGSGLGLIGVRERVAQFGGTVEAGPAPDGGWELRAEIPTGGAP